MPRWLETALRWLILGVATIVTGPPLVLIFFWPVFAPLGDLTGHYSADHLMAWLGTAAVAFWIIGGAVVGGFALARSAITELKS